MEKVEAAKIAEQRADKELASQILRLADHWIWVAAIQKTIAAAFTRG